MRGDALAMVAAVVYVSTKVSTVEQRAADAVTIARAILLECVKQEPEVCALLEAADRKARDEQHAREREPA